MAVRYKTDWICNKCHIGVLNNVPQTLSKACYYGAREDVRVCPKCCEENPIWSFSDDPDCGVKWPDDNIKIIASGLLIGDEIILKSLPAAAFRDGP